MQGACIAVVVCIAFNLLQKIDGFVIPHRRTELAQLRKTAVSATIDRFQVPKVIDEDAWRRYEIKKERASLRVDAKELDEIATMLKADVGRGDNFWGGTFPRLQKRRIEARLNQDLEAGKDIEDSFIELNEAGFSRRLAAQQFVERGGHLRSKGRPSPALLPYIIAQQISDKFEVRRSSADQVEELQRSRVQNRSLLVRMLPRSWHVYVDYLNSLKKAPTTGELVRNMAIAIIFAMLSARARNIRFSFYFGIAGLIMNTSILVMRGAERFQGPRRPGYERAKVVTYSMASYKTALAVALLYGMAGLLSSLTLLKLSPLQLTPNTFLRFCMPVSTLVSGYFSSFYEVYEDKKDAGWRFKRVIAGSATDEINQRLKTKVFGSADGGPFSTVYDFDYNPDVHDFPDTVKYADQVQRHSLKDDETGGTEKKGSDVVAGSGGAGFLDEEESTELFNKWYSDRKDARKDPIDEAEPETPWVGGKKGMYVKSIPQWLDNAYKKSKLKASKWKGKMSKYEREKDMSEEVVFYGPFGFRDKTPDWVQDIETDIWQEKVVASRSVARDYGSYRKSMFKLDKEVKLTKWDGVEDKKKDGKGDKP